MIAALLAMLATLLGATPPDTPRGLRVMAYNTHVGQFLRNGIVRRLVARWHPDIVLLQEVQSPLARLALRAVFPPTKWALTGVKPPSTGRGSPGTIICARRSVLQRTSWSNRIVSGYLNRWHPMRATTVGRYFVRGSGHRLTACSIHTWALGPNASATVRSGHRTQVAWYQSAAAQAAARGDVCVFGGDTNEDITGDGHTPIEQAMAHSGLRSHHPAGDGHRRLDDIFVNCETTAYRALPVPGGEPHHRAVVVDLALPTIEGAHP